MRLVRNATARFRSQPVSTMDCFIAMALFIGAAMTIVPMMLALTGLAMAAAMLRSISPAPRLARVAAQ